MTTNSQPPRSQLPGNPPLISQVLSFVEIDDDEIPVGRALVLPTSGDDELVADDMTAPEFVPILPLRSDVVYPHTVVPLVVNRQAGIRLIDEALAGDRVVGLATQLKPDVEEPEQDELYPILCVGSILKMLRFPDGSTRIICQGVMRARIVELTQTEPYLIARIEVLDEVAQPGVELDALAHHVRTLFERMVEQSQQIPEELQVATLNTRDPGRLADLLGSSLPFSIEEKYELLSETRVRHRLDKLGTFLSRQLAVMELAGKIQAQVGTELTKAQREHFLRQQIKAIQEELGESEGDNPELEALWKRIQQANPPAGVLAEAERELERLAAMHPSSAEYSVVRTYLDWIGSLPWTRVSRDRLDLRRARKILDADHYNLEKIKQRILEYLAVRKLKQDMKGPILCLVGPPGTGKTSLGKSIAHALGREFVRVSLGGVHDESEIRGHRRTYVAAMPGRILQGIRKAGTANPVFMLDEVDKLGNDFRGDPSSALLEVLDPEQNVSFRDHYLDVDFDLSRVMFIATANMLETIPHPLRDRMEILELPGYSEEEKLQIARTHLIPKQLEAHGLSADQVSVTDAGIKRIISDYTREAGLRNLEREIATIFRKVARRFAEGRRKKTAIDVSRLQDYLGPTRHYRELAARTGIPGVATGLAWTPTGGEILFIEASSMPGKGTLMLTGLLGESMKESAQAALTYLRSHCRELELDENLFSTTDVHVHVPAGAVPKDGPSAGVAIAASLLSLFRNQAIARDLAMTGELTLTGRVLPVGGVREKVLAARRAGIKTILLPTHNENDLLELPSDVKADLTFHPVASLRDVVPFLFGSRPHPVKGKPRKPRSRPTPSATRRASSAKPKAKPKPPTRRQPHRDGPPTTR